MLSEKYFTQIDLANGKSIDQLEMQYNSSALGNNIDQYLGNNSVYNVTGLLHLLNSKPVSSYAIENYIYLTSFFILDTGKTFFTKRSGLDSYLLLYTYSGHGLLNYQGKTFRLSRGDGFFIHCTDPHEYRSDDSCWKHAVLHFNGATAGSAFMEFQKSDSWTFHIENPSDFDDKIESILHIYTEYSPHREFFISSALSNFLCFILKQTSRNISIPSVYQDIVNYVDQNFTQNLSLDHLAAKAYMSKYHFAHEFKRYLGYAPKEYISALRVSRAEMLLLTTDLSIEKIGELCGLPNMANFIRIFKNKNGCTPSHFRLQNK